MIELRNFTHSIIIVHSHRSELMQEQSGLLSPNMELETYNNNLGCTSGVSINGMDKCTNQEIVHQKRHS